MVSGMILIRSYSVGSVLPSLDFKWVGENIAGYTISMKFLFDAGNSKTLPATITENGDGDPDGTPAEFYFTFHLLIGTQGGGISLSFRLRSRAVFLLREN